MKKYRIRKLSPLWWLTRVAFGIYMVGCAYTIMCVAVAYAPTTIY